MGRMATYPKSVASSDSCLAASFFKAAEYCSSTRRRSCIRGKHPTGATRHRIVHLEPVRNVRVKLFRMFHSIIEDFDRLRRLEAGLNVFALTKA